MSDRFLMKYLLIVFSASLFFDSFNLIHNFHHHQLHEVTMDFLIVYLSWRVLKMLPVKFVIIVPGVITQVG